MSMGPLFQIYGNVSEIRNLFMLLVLAVLQKHLADGCRKMFFFFFFFLKGMGALSHVCDRDLGAPLK